MSYSANIRQNLENMVRVQEQVQSQEINIIQCKLRSYVESHIIDNYIWDRNLKESWNLENTHDFRMEYTSKCQIYVRIQGIALEMFLMRLTLTKENLYRFYAISMKYYISNPQNILFKIQLVNKGHASREAEFIIPYTIMHI
ncbi:uncharacterized protein LOC109613156 isoform X1 [Musca domestica]|uniref:Uncharacterized protein LOC109613156 isoform X1 n=1 Tax=Musca domestica TaxID=7370 RepID=A0A9J7DG83_MUSDO|nr:uncharacterized protein LOC109613156 isoform X1 [Musca domestica]